MQRPLTSPNSIIVRTYACTDVGRARDHNEDAFVVANLASPAPLAFSDEQTERPDDHGLVFMVADGMGGAASGELASSMAVDIVLREVRARWTGSPEADPAGFADALVAATTTANERIHRHAREHPEDRGMGTTATVAGLLGDVLYVAQVGDSRAYLVRGGVARQLTKDQSLIQRLIEAGELTAEEAETSERRNIILQALGPEATIKIDITRQQLRRGDTLVVCSDGLSGLVRDNEIAEAVMRDSDLHAACSRLVSTANSRGGPDNITVVIARFDGPGLAEAAPTDEIGHQAYRPTEPAADAATAEHRAPPPAVAAAPPEPRTDPKLALDPSRRPPPSTTTLEIAPLRETNQRGRRLPTVVIMVASFIVAVAAAIVFWRLRAH
jgi:PPM family protein phosphatase